MILGLQNGVNIFPNPVSEILNVTANTQIESVQLHAITGQVLRNWQGNVNHARLLVGDLTRGYLCGESSSRGAATVAIIKLYCGIEFRNIQSLKEPTQNGIFNFLSQKKVSPN